MFRLEPPAPAPEIPSRGFVTSFDGYLAPPEDRAGVRVVVDPESERLQLLEPFAAWDGADFLRLPLLLKAQGKCTTDHISPAGVWLRFRGHLENISDNMFSGAVNAFTGESGKGLDQLSGARGLQLAEVARHYKAEGLRWVVVGDENYGEGSSREHAAMSPRLLGCAAVLVRSFARIHESNLKKQGVLPLTFADPSDYEKVREDDRVSVLALADLAPGRKVRVVLHHAGGGSDEIEAVHSLSREQIAWLRAGSALNLLREQSA
jgi:aconitate hydratase